MKIGGVHSGHSSLVLLMFALVQWCGGSDVGKWSIVPTSLIRNIDSNKFLDGAANEIEYMVEWRDGGKNTEMRIANVSG